MFSSCFRFYCHYIPLIALSYSNFCAVVIWLYGIVVPDAWLTLPIILALGEPPEIILEDNLSNFFSITPVESGISNLGIVNTVRLNGGSIDGTTIGSYNPSSGTFTSLTSHKSLSIGDNGKIFFIQKTKDGNVKMSNTQTDKNIFFTIKNSQNDEKAVMTINASRETIQMPSAEITEATISNFNNAITYSQQSKHLHLQSANILDVSNGMLMLS